MDSLRVASIMSTPVISVSADHSVSLALGIMNVKGVRHLPVTERGRLVGLVSQRDLMAAQAASLATSVSADQDPAIPVGKIMKTDLWTVSPDTPILEAARIMLDHRYGCVPVVADGLLVGIVTAIDLLQLLVDALEHRRDREQAGPGRTTQAGR
jgi:CBS domain-containing membrane protein